MTAKEKAKELFDKMDSVSLTTHAAQQCALIAIDEILEATNDDWSHHEYWQEVKTEIEKL